MRRDLARILRYYGCDVTVLLPDGERTVRAFLRPVTSRSLQNLRHSFDELGQIPGGQYVFIGPAGCGLEQAEAVVSQGVRYAPCRAENLLLGDETVCVWGLLTRGGDEDGGAA